MRLVLLRPTFLSATGVVIGSALSAMVAPALSAGFVGLGAINTASYVAIPVLLLLVSMAACYAPARRAAGTSIRCALCGTNRGLHGL